MDRTTQGFELRSAEFRREREDSWKELESLVDRAEKRGLRNLAPDDLEKLPTLYRGAVSALSVARAISLDRNVLDYLTSLASRAYVAVYATKRPPLEAILEFFTGRLPSAFRRFAGFVGASVALMALGVVCGYLLTAADMERYYSFVPESMSQGRDPGASTEELREVLYDSKTATEKLTGFASFLFTHNAKVGILCFALGFAAGVPVVFLLFYNGLLLGAMTALYSSRGLGLEFWAWVLPHGVTELLAVCLCGAAGLAIGSSLVFPGSYSRLENLGRKGRQAALLVLGAVVMLFLAALIEGFFRQLVHDEAARWSVAAATLVAWTLYFARVGRETRR